MVVETESVGGEHRPHYYPIPVYLSFGFGVWARGRVDLSGAIEINPLIDSRSPGESPGARVVHKSPGMLTDTHRWCVFRRVSKPIGIYFVRWCQIHPSQKLFLRLVSTCGQPTLNKGRCKLYGE